MKSEKSKRKNKQKLYYIIAGTFLIVLPFILPGAMADTPGLPTRANTGMVYDSQSDRIVIFGGWNNVSTPPSHQDTWVYDYNNDKYTKKTPSIAPSRRGEMGIIYDSQYDMIVIFGGMEDFTSTGEQNDSWSYDFNTDTWTELFPVSSPSARRAHRMAYDSESEVIVLFGGMKGLSLASATYYNETWVGIPASNTWVKMSPTLAPPARACHHMVYDNESDRIILFGGYSDVGSDCLYDTWAYDYNSNTWEDLTNITNHPPKRSSHIMAYDSESDRVVLFGGGNFLSTYSDTWLYDYNSNTWEQMNPTTSPSARCRHEAAYDSESDRVIIYGGTTGPWDSGSILISETEGKTWAYDVNTNSWTRVDNWEGTITGYNILFLLGILSVVTILVIKKLKKS